MHATLTKDCKSLVAMLLQPSDNQDWAVYTREPSCSYTLMDFGKAYTAKPQLPQTEN